MNMLHKHLVTAGLVAGLGLTAAFAQTPPTGPRHDPAKVEQRIAKKQERHAKRFDRLKAQLQLQAGQEAAWNTWVKAMQPPARRGQRPDFAAMTTPQRIDHMRARRAERTAAADQRAEATKTLYAALSAPQQQAFDAATLRPGRQGHHRHGGRHMHRG